MNILQLYRKAQSEPLDAQELAWIDHEAREHPYFSLPYVVAARHHATNQSTIKDRALLLGAAYCLDRTMLHAYLADALRPASKTIHQEVDPRPSEVPMPHPMEVPQQQPNEVPTPHPMEVPEPDPLQVPHPEPVEVPETEPKEVPEPDEIPEPEPEPIPSPEPATIPEPERPTVPEPDPEEVPSPAPEPQTQPSTELGVNWFLNMRLKLRAQKFAFLGKRIRESVAQYAGPRSVPVPETIAEPVKEKQPEVEVPQGEYAIGAFSSFTFLNEPETGEAGESEIDSMILEQEAVELEAPAQPDAPGHIIFEEEGRVVEISVSPELLSKYFKGRLPVELNFSGEALTSNPSNKSKSNAQGHKYNPASHPHGHRGRQSIIDRFIENEPALTRNGDEIPHGDLSKDSSVDHDDWVTETLAQIYARQGNKSKAVKIYQKLGLLFPEKRDYFASRIAELK